MGFEDDLARVLKRTAVDLQQRAGSIQERELEEALVTAYSIDRNQDSIARQVPLGLHGFRGVGNCDVAAAQDGDLSPILLELKWGADTLYNCAWDAVKLALALHEQEASDAYLVAGAPLADWDSEQRGTDLFGSREWMMQDFMTSYAKEFAFWRSDVKTHPELLPAHFSTREVVQVSMEIADTPWSLRSAQVSSPGDDLVAIGKDGTVSPLLSG